MYFSQKHFYEKKVATEFTFNTCILVKFLKLQRVSTSNKREKYHHISPIINKRYPPTVLDTGKHQVVNLGTYRSTKQFLQKVTLKN